MPNYLTRDGFRIPMPKPGDGTKIVCHRDGTMTCSWDRPRMAMDAALGSKPMGYGSADNGDPDDVDAGSFDLEDKIRQLLEGKLDDADISALIALIQPDEDPKPMPATDRRLPRPPGVSRDSRRITAADAALMRRRVAESGVARAAASQHQFDNLVKRFPNLKNARVV